MLDMCGPPHCFCQREIQTSSLIAPSCARGGREPGGEFPAGVHDINAAVRWVRHLATSDDAWGLDPDRIVSSFICTPLYSILRCTLLHFTPLFTGQGIWGASSGGYYTSIATVLSSATAPTVEGMSPADLGGTVGDHTDVSSSVCCGVDYFGPSDFIVMDEHSEREKGHELVHDAPDSPESSFMGFPIQEKPKLVQQANPAQYVSADTPPMLMAHGDEDLLVPYNQSVLLHAALISAGASSETHPLYIVKGAGHGNGFDDDEALKELTLDFLEEHLKGSSAGGGGPKL